jgi:membrane protease YdiL (CAAX protease family)
MTWPAPDPATRIPDAPQSLARKIALWQGALPLVAWLVSSFLLAIPLVLQGDDAFGRTTVVAVSVPLVVMLIVSVAVSRRWGNGPVADYGLIWNASSIGLGIGYGFALLIGSGLIASALMRFSDEVSSAAADIALSLSGDPIALGLMLFSIVFLAPVAEEMAYRGALFSAMQQRGWNAVVITLVNGGVFAAMHFEPERLLILVLLGCGLAWLRWRTQRTSTTVVAHMVINAFAALGILATL